MKFKNLPVLLVAIMALGFVFTSCEKEELMTENSENFNEQVTINDLPNLKVEDGILCFENEDDMLTTLNVLNTMSDNELEAWENSIGFQSLQSIYENAYNEIDEAKSEDEVLAIVEKHNNLFYIDKNELGEKELYETIKINKLIQNKDMIFRVGDDLFKILPNHIVSCKYEFLSELKEINDVPKDSKNFVYSEIETLSKANAYGASDFEENSDNNRQCYLDLYTNVYQTVNGYYTTVYVSKFMVAKTYGKKKSIGIWRRYKTKLDIFFYNLYISCEEDPWQYLEINNTGWGAGSDKREYSVSRRYAYYTASFPHMSSKDVFYKYKVRARNMDMSSDPVNVQYNQ